MTSSYHLIALFNFTILPLLAGGCGILLKRSPEPTTAIEDRSYHPDTLLSHREYTSLVVEIDYVTGCKPDDYAIGGLRKILSKYCYKPDGIEIVVDDEITSIGKAEAVSDSDCYDIFYEYADIEIPEGAFHLYILYIPYLADRPSGKGSRGWCSFNEPLIVIARKKIHEYAVMHITAPKIERLVLVHEIGHAFGLVVNDEHEYRGHCTNPSCVMYYDLDWRVILANSIPAIFGILPDDFCEECQRDIETMRRQKSVSEGYHINGANPHNQCYFGDRRIIGPSYR